MKMQRWQNKSDRELVLALFEGGGYAPERFRENVV